MRVAIHGEIRLGEMKSPFFRVSIPGRFHFGFTCGRSVVLSRWVYSTEVCPLTKDAFGGKCRTRVRGWRIRFGSLICTMLHCALLQSD
ncbi:hypothetical protein CDAR_117871 [Caerostris darwini]|uniref:Uncharacterized protein n=1 Tax=Caerostris darwini TaxID=1538125 RepID=A0AAV4PX70_9ARAC|nr:hypothetical protein CDAR_117871 [Caerostris darwini]